MRRRGSARKAQPAAIGRSCKAAEALTVRGAGSGPRNNPAGFNRRVFLAVYSATHLGYRYCLKRECGRGDRYGEMVQCD